MPAAERRLIRVLSYPRRVTGSPRESRPPQARLR